MQMDILRCTRLNCQAIKPTWKDFSQILSVAKDLDLDLTKKNLRARKGDCRTLLELRRKTKLLELTTELFQINFKLVRY